MKVIDVPQPKVVIFHPDGSPFQVLLFDDNGNRVGKVTFEADDHGHALAYEYAAFKEQ